MSAPYQNQLGIVLLKYLPTMTVCFACSALSIGERKDAFGLTASKCTSDEEAKQVKDTVALRNLVNGPVFWSDASIAKGSGSRAHVKLLGFNDFHGQLSTDKSVEGRPVGGAAVLGAYFKASALGMETDTMIIHAGDLVGASPPASALHHDEPSVEFLNALCNAACTQPAEEPSTCNVVTTLGNHELDEGMDEINRLLHGGEAGSTPFFDKPYRGARFLRLSSNVIDTKTGNPFLPPYLIVETNGVRIGFAGAVLRDAGKYLMPSGISSFRFEDEKRSIQNAVDALKKKGVRAIVVILHEGGHQNWTDPSGVSAPAVIGVVTDIVGALDEEVDVVISGHTHSPINILLPSKGKKPVLVTQSFFAGTAFANIDLEIDRTGGDVVRKSSRIVTTWADEGPGLNPDPEIAALVDRAESAVRARTSQVVATAAAEFPKEFNCDGESAIGNLIADAERSALKADFAFIQPTWIRAGINTGPVTWGDIFAVQPFGNRVVLLEMTGNEILSLLNQQWIDETHSRILNVSGLAFTWDPSRPVENRIVEVTVSGKPIDKTASYTVAVNELLAAGGESYSTFTRAKRLGQSKLDIDTLEEYLRAFKKPVSPKIEGRVRRIK